MTKDMIKVADNPHCGVVYNSVAKVHRSNSHTSEVVTELLLGTPVRVMEQIKGWRRIETPEGYPGWISEAIVDMSEEELRTYNSREKVIVVVPYTVALVSGDAADGIVSPLTAGNILNLVTESEHLYGVEFPDGRKGYLPKVAAWLLTDWMAGIELTAGSVIGLAQRFMGVPYVWGGTSAHGLDCSGFTKLVFFLHGVILPRDASQQVECGELVDETGEFSKLLPGDLVFFGERKDDGSGDERVVHVGFYIGDMRFIHASDYVMIGSFDPADSLYDEFNTNRYLRTKRLLSDSVLRALDTISKNEFYN